MSTTRKRQAFLVIKEEFERAGVPEEDRLSLVKSFDSQEAAALEVQRLARIDEGKPWRYYWQEWTVETPADQ